MIYVTRILAIDESALEERFIRASGPGGQNVNKVSTAVELRLDTSRLALGAGMRQRLAILAGSRMTGDGVLVIQAQRFRSQAQNRADARRRLTELLHEAAIEPRVRRKSKPSRGERAQRLASKRRRAQTKQRRNAPRDE